MDRKKHKLMVFVWLVVNMTPYFLIYFDIRLLITFFILNEIILRLSRQRLNLYYIFSRQKDGLYLHHSPWLFFYWSDRKKLIEYRENAIQKLIDRFPDEPIFTKTLTLQRVIEDQGIQGEVIEQNFHDISSTYCSIILNLRNLVKWKWRKLYKDIDQIPLKKYRMN